MPHIKPERRADFDTELDAFPLPKCKGDLTYVILRLQMRFAAERGGHYQELSDAVAAAHDASHQFERRVLDPYEDLAAARNGDVVAIYYETERL